MKKSIRLFSLGAVGALMLAACSGEKGITTADSLQMVTVQYEQASSFNDSLLLLMGDIYDGLDSINMQEGLLYSMDKGGEKFDRRAEVRQNLQNIKDRLQQNRELLSQMQAKLDKTGGENSVLKKTIADLQARIDRQEAKIAELNTQLEAANAEIVQLNEQVTKGQEDLKAETEAREQAQAEATAAENNANRVYYAIGTNKELKQNGLLEKKFLGSTKVLKGDFNENYFTAADKRNLSVINTGGKKVKIWSNVPKGSYEIIDNDNGTQSIKILNSQEFWQLTPYLIIQIN
ncbi:MAG: hypothetical protein K2H38_04650 [Muribaculaceae bacterium]|nr:hypothetical protein [Muribaculaceae bacterium]